MIDPIVEEVRRYRMEHTQKFGGDLKRICDDLRRIQQESGLKVVRLPPKLLKPCSGEAMEEGFEIPSRSHDTGQSDLAARHDEHQP
jgi:hypothetical protein